MAEKCSHQNIMIKSMRSVFVGNIPFDATEEKLKEIFRAVGPVLSLKLVVDRESGKPKGYGFCEYKDQETALSAMRNLNGHEMGGRTLRVDNACTEKSRMEMQHLMQGPQVESPYGDHCAPDKAPEIITQQVASMPPEQMYELIRQTKHCIQNNPSEARQMLLANPQLAYALLQSLVMQGFVDPQAALKMLFKTNQMPPVLGLTGQPQEQPQPLRQGVSTPQGSPSSCDSVMSEPQSRQNPIPRNIPHKRPNEAMPCSKRTSPTEAQQSRESRKLNISPNPVPPPSNGLIQRTPLSKPIPRPGFIRTEAQRFRDPRLRRDLKLKRGPTVLSEPQPEEKKRRLTPSGVQVNASDQEKASLIMQVINLTDEQIAKLTPDQRSSLLDLRKQIAGNSSQG